MSEGMSLERLRELEGLCEGATPGPWDIVPAEMWPTSYVVLEDMNTIVAQVTNQGSAGHQADARFLAASRTALPEALAEIRRLREELTRERAAHRESRRSRP